MVLHSPAKKVLINLGKQFSVDDEASCPGHQADLRQNHDNPSITNVTVGMRFLLCDLE